MSDHTAAQIREIFLAIERLNASVEKQGEAIKALQERKQEEVFYQKFLERHLNGKHMRIPGIGTTDVTTDDAHIEIKIWRRFHEVPGQLSKYNQGVPRPRKCVYFFGEAPSEVRIGTIKNMMQEHSIEMYSFDVNDEIVEHWVPGEAESHPTPFNTWLSQNLVAAPNRRVHIHRFQRAFNRGRPERDQIELGLVKQRLTALKYELFKQGKDAGCCDTPNQRVLNVDVKGWDKGLRRVMDTEDPGR